jgi:hypothetical protein
LKKSRQIRSKIRGKKHFGLPRNFAATSKNFTTIFAATLSRFFARFIAYLPHIYRIFAAYLPHIYRVFTTYLPRIFGNLSRIYYEFAA